MVKVILLWSGSILTRRVAVCCIFLSQMLVGMVHGISWVERLLNGRVWQGSDYIPDTIERKKKLFIPLQIVRVFKQGLQFAA